MTEQKREYATQISVNCPDVEPYVYLAVRTESADNPNRQIFTFYANDAGLEQLENLVLRLRAQKISLDNAAKERLREATKEVIDAQIRLDQAAEKLKYVVKNEFAEDKEFCALVLAHEDFIEEKHAALHGLIQAVDKICGRGKPNE